MVWRGFTRLRSTRINGFAVGAIPWHECVRWAQHEGLDDEETETLIEVVEKLDLRERELASPKEKKDKGDGTDGKTRA